MQLTIWTHWQGREWSGDVPGVAEGTAVSAVLEYVFRQFNAVDDGDRERMLAVGYDLPSLSVGDVVTFADGTRWQCEPLGWELLEDGAVPRTPEQLRAQAAHDVDAAS
jgi:hypothetical protein